MAVPGQFGQSLALRTLCALGLLVGVSSFTGKAKISNGTAVPLFESAPLLNSGFPFASRGTSGVGDFDGDRHTDVAIARPQGLINGAYRYRVEVLLSSQPDSSFDVDSGVAGGLHISTRDVDGDFDLDLVITSEFGREPVGVWINNGNGSFTKSQFTNYSASIWQEPDRWFETPGVAVHLFFAFVVPTGGWTLSPVPSGRPALRQIEARFPAAREGYARKALNWNSPLRAPPLS